MFFSLMEICYGRRLQCLNTCKVLTSACVQLSQSLLHISVIISQLRQQQQINLPLITKSPKERIEEGLEQPPSCRVVREFCKEFASNGKTKNSCSPQTHKPKNMRTPILLVSNQCFNQCWPGIDWIGNPKILGSCWASTRACM